MRRYGRVVALGAALTLLARRPPILGGGRRGAGGMGAAGEGSCSLPPGSRRASDDILAGTGAVGRCAQGAPGPAPDAGCAAYRVEYMIVSKMSIVWDW